MTDETALWSLTGAEVTRRVKAREVSAREVAQSVLERIDAVNGWVNAVVARCDEEALAAADAVDAAVARGEDPGPMAGVAVTIKDNVDQKGHATTSGLKKLKDLVAAEDSPMVTNLRAAGAVIVGRSNMPAVGMRWFTNNQLFGLTRNPRNGALTSGGSSGGAGAAVAAGMGPIGQGGDIAGSIRFPAYCNGVHGIRPSQGRVPGFNASGPPKFISPQLMVAAGPLARSIEDLRISLASMSVPDPRDPASAPLATEGPAYARRVALCYEPGGMKIAPKVRAALTGAAKALEAAGWSVEEVETPPIRDAVLGNVTLWMSDYRRNRGKDVESFDDPEITFIYEHLQRHAPEPDLDRMMDILQLRYRLQHEWRMFLTKWPVLLLPVCGETPFPANGDVASAEAFDAIFEAQTTMMGLPFMSLPGLTVTTDLSDGVPCGVQIVSDLWREDIMFAAGDVIGKTVPAQDPIPPAV